MCSSCLATLTWRSGGPDATASSHLTLLIIKLHFGFELAFELTANEVNFVSAGLAMVSNGSGGSGGNGLTVSASGGSAGSSTGGVIAVVVGVVGTIAEFLSFF